MNAYVNYIPIPELIEKLDAYMVGHPSSLMNKCLANCNTMYYNNLERWCDP